MIGKSHQFSGNKQGGGGGGDGRRGGRTEGGRERRGLVGYQGKGSGKRNGKGEPENTNDESVTRKKYK